MRRVVLAALLVPTLLAGCTKPDDDGGDTDTADTDADQIGDSELDDTQVGDSDTEVGDTDTDVTVDTDTDLSGDTDTGVDPGDTDTDVVPGDTDTDVVPVDTDTDAVPGDTDTDVVPDDTEVVPVDTDTDVLPGDTDTVPGDSDSDVVIVDTDTLPADSDSDGPADTVVTDTEIPPVDDDHDGFPAAVDCDDEDPAVNPGAAEACNGVDDDCDGQIDDGAASAFTLYVDGDGDGYGGASYVETGCALPAGAITVGGDCDDADPTTFPGATEVCDDADDDCDGAVDEDATDASTWYADADADGYGDPAAATVACDAPAGAVPDATDCDDADDTVSPASVEACDGVDDDCDGLIDEAGAGGETASFADADRDGYGDASTSQWACVAAPGRVTDATDCDDAAADVHPDAVEHCDGRDEDCDDVADDDAVDRRRWYEDGDDDGYGVTGSSVLACEAPPDGVADAGDCDDDRADVHPGATEACDHLDDDCDGSVDESGASGEVTTWADVDRDGYGDPASAQRACFPAADRVTDATDCDDAAPAIHPGATEHCDDVDEDCDAAIDDEAVDRTAWYADVDHDGYGAAGASTLACDAPPSTSAIGGDCDDARAAVSPAATEACNGRDDDCDAAVDEAGAVGEVASYVDGDADGFGDPSTAQSACTVPPDRVTVGADCDDADTYVYPGAPELCDGQANDCGTAAAWVAADEAGLVTWTPVFAPPVDVTASFTGAVTLARGRYDLCPGTHTVQLTGNPSGSTELRGVGGRDAVVLDADGFGRVLDVAGSSVVVRDLSLVHGLALRGGGVGVGVGRLELHGVRIATSEAIEVGGGLWVGPNGYAQLTDTVVETSRATAGGAIAVEGQLEATGGTLGSCDATDGGGLYVSSGGAARLESTVVTGNRALDGGGVVVDGGTVDLVEVEVSDNDATRDGGGVKLTVGVADRVTLTGGWIAGNVAVRDGGGLLVDVASSLVVDGTSLEANKAGGHGGNLAARLTGDLTLTTVDLLGGHANVAGGGLWVSGGRLFGDQVTVAGNDAGVLGGGAWLGYGEVQLTDAWIDENVCTGSVRGGGLYLERGQFRLVGGEVFGNGGTDVVGGGLYVDLSTTILEDVLVGSNAALDGGGIYAATTSDAPLVIGGETLVRDNAAGRKGGGLYLASGDAYCGGGVAERHVGFLANQVPLLDSGAGVFVAGTSLSARFTATSCDMGVDQTADDNVSTSPFAWSQDVTVESPLQSYASADDDTYVCVSTLGCF